MISVHSYIFQRPTAIFKDPQQYLNAICSVKIYSTIITSQPFKSHGYEINKYVVFMEYLILAQYYMFQSALLASFLILIFWYTMYHKYHIFQYFIPVYFNKSAILLWYYVF
jgi:hypothetical protein